MSKEFDSVKTFCQEQNEPSAQAAVDTMSDYVNRYGYASDNLAFAKELNEDSEAAGVFDLACLAWINRLAYIASLGEERFYDLRNKSACLFGEKAKGSVELPKDGPIYSFFAEQMSREHRTLQQSFTSLVLVWMRERAGINSYFADILKATEDRQAMPLI